MKIPVHLNALRAFEASARHQSFSLAAEELNVTPAAVGQLVRSLEEVVGFPLFIEVITGVPPYYLQNLHNGRCPTFALGSRASI